MPLLPDAPEPAGFGNCALCPYMRAGSAQVCFDCASQTLERLAPERCPTCDSKLPPAGRCGNPLCNRTVEERGWDRVYAISMRTGPLKRAISRYKYEDKWGWARIFGRVLVGYLQAHEDVFREYGLIVPMPTYVGPGGRDRDHTAEVIEWAKVEDPSWPFRMGVVAKTRATPRLAEVRGGFAVRAHVAEARIGPALEVAKPELVKGAAVLVFDDVFTGGLTLREIARELLDAGATRISGVVLARQPYARQPGGEGTRCRTSPGESHIPDVT